VCAEQAVERVVAVAERAAVAVVDGGQLAGGVVVVLALVQVIVAAGPGEALRVQVAVGRPLLALLQAVALHAVELNY
jgi:hypothetical protein